MVSLFKDRSPAAIFWLLLLSCLVHSHLFVDFAVIKTAPYTGLLSYFLNRYMPFTGPLMGLLIYHTLVLLQGLRLNYLFTDSRMYSRPSYLPGMVYILLTGAFPEWSSISPSLVINTMVIWLFAKCIRLYNSPEPKTLLFNTGLLIGLTTILYHPAAFLVLVAFFALVILRPFDMAEILVLIMGSVTPYYFLFSYLYLTNHFKDVARYIPLWDMKVPVVTNPLMTAVSVTLLLLVLVIGFVYGQVENRRLVIQVRKSWSVLLVMLVVILPVPFISRNAGIDSLLLWIVPASPFVANAFILPKKNTLPALLFWALFALAIIGSWHLVK